MKDGLIHKSDMEQLIDAVWQKWDIRDMDQFRDGLLEALAVMPSTQLECKTGRWIPCSERLPEEDKEVLISYRYKEGEGDTSHVEMDITTYGQMYFGGNKVGNHKHWRAPFEYFESNYEVIAWMPLPEPYKDGGRA